MTAIGGFIYIEPLTTDRKLLIMTDISVQKCSYREVSEVNANTEKIAFLYSIPLTNQFNEWKSACKDLNGVGAFLYRSQCIQTFFSTNLRKVIRPKR